MKTFSIYSRNKPYMTALVGDLADRVNDLNLRLGFLFQSRDDAARVLAELPASLDMDDAQANLLSVREIVILDR